MASVTSGVASGVGVASALSDGDSEGASSSVGELSGEVEAFGSAERADCDGLGVTGALDSWRGSSTVADTEGSAELSSGVATEWLAPEKFERSSAALNSAAVAVR
ncbi:hypothetical protein GCM10023190_16670 [Enteractinococcus fodinae]